MTKSIQFHILLCISKSLAKPSIVNESWQLDIYVGCSISFPLKWKPSNAVQGYELILTSWCQHWEITLWDTAVLSHDHGFLLYISSSTVIFASMCHEWGNLTDSPRAITFQLKRLHLNKERLTLAMGMTIQGNPINLPLLLNRKHWLDHDSDFTAMKSLFVGLFVCLNVFYSRIKAALQWNAAFAALEYTYSRQESPKQNLF